MLLDSEFCIFTVLRNPFSLVRTRYLALRMNTNEHCRIDFRELCVISDSVHNLLLRKLHHSKKRKQTIQQQLLWWPKANFGAATDEEISSFASIVQLHSLWCRGVVVIATAQFHSINSEVRFCAGTILLPKLRRFAMMRIYGNGLGWK